MKQNRKKLRNLAGDVFTTAAFMGCIYAGMAIKQYQYESGKIIPHQLKALVEQQKQYKSRREQTSPILYDNNLKRIDPND
tara:strand:+ start:1068 stop:1307 length:240 start_codon:yes stop_codon:yes gene_type:complete